MMKKLLVLTLILGLASVANAAYVDVTLDIAAPTTAEKDTDFTVTVTVSGLATGRSVKQVQYVKHLISGGAYTADDADITPDPIFELAASILVLDGMTLADQTSGVPGITNGNTIWTFVVQGADVGDTLSFGLDDQSAGAPNYQYMCVYLDDNSQSFLVDYGGGQLTINGDSTEIIPEPMTVALLGLGGLFLRRRR